MEAPTNAPVVQPMGRRASHIAPINESESALISESEVPEITMTSASVIQGLDSDAELGLGDTSNPNLVSKPEIDIEPEVASVHNILYFQRLHKTLDHQSKDASSNTYFSGKRRTVKFPQHSVQALAGSQACDSREVG